MAIPNFENNRTIGKKGGKGNKLIKKQRALNIQRQLRRNPSKNNNYSAFIDEQERSQYNSSNH